MLDSELAAEQAHVDRAYERLEELRAQAIELARRDLEEHAPTPAAMLERDVREAHGRRRYGSLNVDAGLCFGRIDRADGDSFHLGRVGVAEADLTPLVVDWRAPVAEAFYRATPLDPLGLVRRRHLLTRGRTVVDIQDEALDLDTSSRRDDLTLVGEAALLDALTERRTGRMRDIVSTIQAEQDAIIRAPLRGVLVVQGGPGTGKTAVALHRAAFLLYRHRFPLEEQGVLVVGPNPVFLRYIERVLPSLGESHCRLATVDDLHRLPARGPEPRSDVARLKGEGRMVEVIRRAVETRERALRNDDVVAIGSYRLGVTRPVTKRIVQAVRRRPGTHNERRPLVARLLTRHLAGEYAAAVDRAARAGLPATALSDADLADAITRSPDVRRILERMWPALTAEDLLSDLFRHPAMLRAAAAGLLDEAEIESLRREEREGSAWTTSDLPLLDEADEVLGAVVALPRPRAGRPDRAALEEVSLMVDRVLADRIPECLECEQELSYDAAAGTWQCSTDGCGRVYEPHEVMSPAAAQELRDLRRRVHDLVVADDDLDTEGRFATYGHIVVDEAQELTFMQWRMLARRCPAASFTIAGDNAQRTAPTTIGRWDHVIDALASWSGSEAKSPGARLNAGFAELTVNYRTPSEVMEIADRLIPGASARCVRSSGVQPRRVAAVQDGALVALAADLARSESAAVVGGKVGVIAPPALAGRIADELGVGSSTVLDDEITVLPPNEAKGLEFDSVVVVEPAALTDSELYVALTRCTTRLVLVHTGELPPSVA